MKYILWSIKNPPKRIYHLKTSEQKTEKPEAKESKGTKRLSRDCYIHDTKRNYTSPRLETAIVDIRPIRMESSRQHIAIPNLRPRSQTGELSILDTTNIRNTPTSRYHSHICHFLYIICSLRTIVQADDSIEFGSIGTELSESPVRSELIVSIYTIIEPTLSLSIICLIWSRIERLTFFEESIKW
jgi:hypothetical protein